MQTAYTLSDGNASETYHTLSDACSAAEDWYDFLLAAVDDVDDELREAVRSADFGDCATVEQLRAAISDWEYRIAKASGYADFHGHGAYHVSAADAMGLSLVCQCEEEDEEDTMTTYTTIANTYETSDDDTIFRAMVAAETLHGSPADLDNALEALEEALGAELTESGEYSRGQVSIDIIDACESDVASAFGDGPEHAVWADGRWVAIDEDGARW
jgi:hypothetical protein